MADVTLTQVGKSYENTFQAVIDFNLSVKHGEFLVMVGPSGCGKSTTLRMIAGLEEITTGEIRIGDRVVNDVPPKDRDIAMVFQNYALYPHMTVYKNMAFGLRLRKVPKAEIKQRIESAAEILGITELLTRKPRALSGGQKQRVAVGRAIVRDPAVFLFDEPLSNLDAKLRTQMRVEIKSLHNRLGATMIYVTHDQVEAMTMGDRIVVMKDGYIQQVADPMTLYHQPANTFVAGFIGTPPMNLLTGSCAGGTISLDSGVKITGVDCPDLARMTLGIRPEDIGSAVAEASPDSPRLQSFIRVVEPTGSETYLYLDVNGTDVVSRIVPREGLQPGAKIELAVDRNRLHFFDGESGQRLG